MGNVLSFRGKVTQAQMQEEMIKTGQVLQNLGVQKNGPVTTVRYAVEQVENEQVMDIEILHKFLIKRFSISLLFDV